MINYNYGSFDAAAHVLKYDVLIKIEEHKSAKNDFNRKNNLKNAAIVIKTAVVVAAFFLRRVLGNIGLATLTLFGKCFKIKNDNDPDIDATAIAKTAHLAALRLKNSQAGQLVQSALNGLATLFT